jgi:3-oxoacyl-[acyl-carrier protein] reductase
MQNATELCLPGQSAIVTGAGGGIGIATCAALAQAGADIVINDYGNEEGCKATASAVEAAGRKALVCDANVADMSAVEGMVAQTLDEFGKIDILINNAGITRDALLLRMDEEQWDAVLAVNLRGAFCCTKGVVRPMMKQRGGCIIYISSVVGVMGNAGQANYAASKAGLIGLMKSVAKELAARNIRANAIAPGFVDTAMTRALTDEQRENLLSAIPLGRIAEPEDVAQAALFLCSPAARYITGHVLNVDGGMAM